MHRKVATLALILGGVCLISGHHAGATIVISEFRLRGPNGANDEFVEIYNKSNAAHTVTPVDNTNGYALAASDGVIRFTIPKGTVIPAHGHWLGVNSVGYSLASYPAGNGTTATGDATYTTDIPDNAGIALFQTMNPASFTLANRLDAVGSTAEDNALYREGFGYPSLTPFSINYAFYRDTRSGAPKDTDNNAPDFVFVDTNGTSAGAGQRLGSPGPQNLTSPIRSSLPGKTGITVTLLDPTQAADAPPNQVRDFTSDPANNSTFGTMDFRRKVTNNTGSNITRLRFCVSDLTTFPAPSGTSDLRPRTSTAVVVTTSAGNVTVQGTTLEQPPSQPNGGGFNSTMSVGTVTLATPIAPGASINVRFLVGLQQTGCYRLMMEDGLFLAQGGTDVPSTVQFSAESYEVSENAGHATITITRPVACLGETDVQFNTQNGSAVAGQDYTLTQWSVHFATGQIFAAVTVPITNDGALEGDETLQILLSNATGVSTLGSPALATLTIKDDETPNQPPVNTVPGVQQIASGSTGFFSKANGKLICVDDPDAAASSIRITLIATHGTLTLAQKAFLTFSVGDGTQDSAMIFTGSKDAVNTGLDGMSFKADDAYEGLASITITTDDQGNTGTGGARSDTDAVPLAIVNLVVPQTAELLRMVGGMRNTSSASREAYDVIPDDKLTMRDAVAYFHGIQPRGSGAVVRDASNAFSAHGVYINDPSLNANPDARLIVTHHWMGNYEATLGVWYDAAARKWVVYNEDLSPLANGEMVNYIFDNRIRRTTRSAANAGAAHQIRLSDPSLDGRTSATTFAVHEFVGAYQADGLGVFLDGSNNWRAYNEDFSPMANGERYLFVDAGSEASKIIRSAANAYSSYGVYLNDPRLNEKPDAIVVAQHSYRTVTNKSAVGVWYNQINKRWAVYNENQAPMSNGEVIHYWVR